MASFGYWVGSREVFVYRKQLQKRALFLGVEQRKELSNLYVKKKYSKTHQIIIVEFFLPQILQEISFSDY